MTDAGMYNPEAELIRAVQGNVDLSNRVKLVQSLNPMLRSDPQTAFRMAALPVSTTDLGMNAYGMYGMMATDNMRVKLDAMTPSQQRMVWNRLPRAQQMALSSQDYRPPEADDYGFFDFVGDVVTTPFELVAAPLKGLGQITKPVWQPALEGLSWAADQPAHIYRAIRTMDDGQQWAGLAGAILGIGAAAATIATGGAALGFFAAAGTLGAAGLAGATAGSILADPLNPMDFGRAWMDTQDGERAFDRAASRAAEDMLGDPRLNTLATEIADIADRSIYEMAREVAGAQEADEAQRPNSYMTELVRIADGLAAPNTAQHERVMQSLQKLMSEPVFLEAVNKLQKGKISIGRDLADNITKISPMTRDSALYTLVSGGTDALFQIAVDPFLIAGRVADVAKFRKLGIDLLEGQAAVDRFQTIAEKVPSVVRRHEKMAEAVVLDDFRRARALGAADVQLWSQLRTYRANLQEIGIETFGAAEVRSYFKNVDQLRSVMSGLGTVRGKDRMIIKGFNARNESYYNIAQNLRSFTSGLTDIRTTRQFMKAVVESGDSHLFDQMPGYLKPYVLAESDVPMLEMTSKLSEVSTKGQTYWKHLYDMDNAVVHDHLADLAGLLKQHALLPDDDIAYLDDLHIALAQSPDFLQVNALEDVTKRVGEIAERTLALPRTAIDESMLNQYAMYNELKPEARAMGQLVAKFVPRLGHAIGSALQMATTQIPVGGGIALAGDEAPESIYRFMESLRLTGVPEYMRRMWLDNVLLEPLGGTRAKAMLTALDNGLTVAGMRSLHHGDEFVDKFLLHAQHAYGFGGRIDRTMLENGRRVASSPLIDDSATMMHLPNLSDLRKLTRAGFMANLVGISDIKHLDSFVNKVWKPAVLLRMAFIPRAAGEEWINFMLRGGFGGMVQEYGGRYVGQYRAWEKVMNKVDKLGSVKVGNGALTADELAIYQRGPLPTFLRPVEQMMNRYGYDGPMYTKMKQFADSLQQFLTPQEMLTTRGMLNTSERVRVVNGRGATGLQKPVDRLIQGIGGDARKGIDKLGLDEGAVRRAARRDGTLSRFVPTAEIARLNVSQYADSLLMGSATSWRRMVAGGLNEDVIKSGERFALEFRTTLLREVSASDASNYERGYRRDDLTTIEVPDGKGGTKSMQVIAMRGGWKRHFRADGDPLFAHHVHQGVSHTVMSDRGGKELSRQIVARILPPSVQRTEIETFLNRAQELSDETSEVFAAVREGREVLRARLYGYSRPESGNPILRLLMNRLPHDSSLTIDEVVRQTEQLLAKYTSVQLLSNGKAVRVWAEDLPEEIIREMWGAEAVTQQMKRLEDEFGRSMIEKPPARFGIAEDLVRNETKSLFGELNQVLTDARANSIDAYEFYMTNFDLLRSSPQTLTSRLTPSTDDVNAAIEAWNQGTPVLGGVQLPATSKYVGKDQAKADQASLFIGQGSSRSSTEAYRQAFGTRANVGTYSSRDVVFVSAEGNRSGRVAHDADELARAMNGEATIITDVAADRTRAYNIGERQVATQLTAGGYVEVTPGRWRPGRNVNEPQLQLPQPTQSYRFYDSWDEANDDMMTLLRGLYTDVSNQELAALGLQASNRGYAENDKVSLFRVDPAVTVPNEIVDNIWQITSPIRSGVADRDAVEVAQRLVDELTAAAGRGPSSMLLQHREELTQMFVEQMRMIASRNLQAAQRGKQLETFFGLTPVGSPNSFGQGGKVVRLPEGMAASKRVNESDELWALGLGDDLPRLEMLFGNEAMADELNMAMKNLMARYGKQTAEIPQVMAVRLPRAVTTEQSTSVASPLQTRIDIRNATRDATRGTDVLQLKTDARAARQPLRSEVRRVAGDANTGDGLVWTVDRRFAMDNSVPASALQPVDGAAEYAERMIQHFKSMVSKQMREGHTAKLQRVEQIAEDGTRTIVEMPRVYRYGGEGEGPVMVEPGEMLWNDTKYVTERGDEIKYGDENYFAAASVTYDENDLMWELVGPMVRDNLDELRPAALEYRRKNEMMMVRGKLEQSKDWVRVYRSNDSQVPSLAYGGPSMALGPEYKVVDPKLWDKIVQFGFDRVIGPSIDAIVRRPMAFHFFHQRYSMARRMNGWMLDADLAGRAEQGLQHALFNNVVASPDQLDEWGNLFSRVAQIRGHSGAENWARRHSLAWARGHQPNELFDMLRQTDDLIEARLMAATLDPAEKVMLTQTKVDIQKTSRALLDAVKGKAINTGRFGEQEAALQFMQQSIAGSPIDDLVARMESELPVGSLSSGERLMRNWNRAVGSPSSQVIGSTLSLKQAENISAYWKHSQHIEEMAGHYAAEAALRDIMPFIDSHEIRTQFAEYGKGLMPFWYAEENFLKRWARTIVDDPTVIRKAQLTYAGLRNMGIVRQDEQGRDWFVYPGSGLLVETLSKVMPGAGVAAIGTMFQSPTDSLFPGMSERFGAPSFSPFVSVPMDLVSAVFPDLKPAERALLGDYAANRNALQHLVPTTLLNFWDAGIAAISENGIDETNPRYASAMMAAIAHLEASGDGVSKDASAEERDLFLRRVRNHARVILVSQSIAGFFTPGPPQALITGETGNFSGFGVQDPRDVINAQYQTLIRQLGIDEGTKEFLRLNPDGNVFNLVNPLALTVGKTESSSGAPLPTTEGAIAFFNEHSEYLKAMPMAGPWLLPTPKQGDTRVQYAFDQQTLEGLRTQLTPEEFLYEIKYKEAAPTYFAEKKAHLDEIDRLKMAGDDYNVRIQNERWELFSTSYRAAHPIFDEQMRNSNATLRRSKILEEMRVAVGDPGVPPSPQIEGLREIMTEWDYYNIALRSLREDRSAAGRARVEQAKATFEKIMDDLLVRQPDLRSFYLAVIRPEANFD